MFCNFSFANLYLFGVQWAHKHTIIYIDIYSGLYICLHAKKKKKGIAESRTADPDTVTIATAVAVDATVAVAATIRNNVTLILFD